MAWYPLSIWDASRLQTTACRVTHSLRLVFNRNSDPSFIYPQSSNAVMSMKQPEAPAGLDLGMGSGECSVSQLHIPLFTPPFSLYLLTLLCCAPAQQCSLQPSLGSSHLLFLWPSYPHETCTQALPAGWEVCPCSVLLFGLYIICGIATVCARALQPKLRERALLLQTCRKECLHHSNLHKRQR